MQLPSPKPSQPFFYVSVLESGYIALGEHFVVEGGSPTKKPMAPSLSFLLRHSKSGKKIIFDLGIRKDWEEYPPDIVKVIKLVATVDVPVDAVGSLHRGGVSPHEVETVILSHVHFDHIGDPLLFPSSHFVVGAGSADLLAKGYVPGETKAAAEPHYARDLLPESRTSYLSSDDWKPIGPFPRGHDFLGDGSLYLIDSAAHLPGHLNALVRTSADGSWVFLAGDSAHDIRLITGEKKIGMFPNPVTGSSMCLHQDHEEAKLHIERMKEMHANPKVQVLLAHDFVWFGENKDKGVIFPRKIPSL